MKILMTHLFKIEFFVSPFEIFHCMIDNKIEKGHGESVCLVTEKNEGEGRWRKIDPVCLLENNFFKKSEF